MTGILYFKPDVQIVNQERKAEREIESCRFKSSINEESIGIVEQAPKKIVWRAIEYYKQDPHAHLRRKMM